MMTARSQLRLKQRLSIRTVRRRLRQHRRPPEKTAPIVRHHPRLQSTRMGPQPPRPARSTRTARLARHSRARRHQTRRAPPPQAPALSTTTQMGRRLGHRPARRRPAQTAPAQAARPTTTRPETRPTGRTST